MNPNEAEEDSTHIFIRWRPNEVYDEAAGPGIGRKGRGLGFEGLSITSSLISFLAEASFRCECDLLTLFIFKLLLVTFLIIWKWQSGPYPVKTHDEYPCFELSWRENDGN